MVSVMSDVTKSNMPAKSVLHNTPLIYKDKAIAATVSGFHASFGVALGFAVLALFLAFFLKKGNRAREAAALKGKEENN